MKDIVEKLNVGVYECSKCGGNENDYLTMHEAIGIINQLRAEVERLTAEVERLRLTSQEMELIRLGVHRLKEVEDCELGTDIEDIAARLRGDE